MGWQPIETAPKDGTEVLLIGRYPSATSTPTFSDIYHGWRSLKGHWTRWPHPFDPTHWMPLPDPPAKEGRR